MGEAREVMDRLTMAVFGTKDLKAAAECYSSSVTAITPDQGEINGRDHIVEYMRQMLDAFPDVRYEHLARHESDHTAIDEGHIVGTHSGPLVGPAGESIPPTGRMVRVRGCDVVTVEAGQIVEHRLYFDQVELLGQLGLLDETP